MLGYYEALAIAIEHAKRDGTSQVVAESMQHGGFVVGPARGWNPPADLFVKRTKVKDTTFDVEHLDGFVPP